MLRLGMISVVATIGLCSAGCTVEEVGYNVLQAVAPAVASGAGTSGSYRAYQAERDRALSPTPTPTFAWRRPES